MHLRGIVISILLTLCGLPAYSQTRPSAVDKALDEYESLLKEAISLKRSSVADERVLEYELYNLANRLSSIRKTLGTGSKMTDAQKARLAALVKWYEAAAKGIDADVMWVAPVSETPDTVAVVREVVSKTVCQEELSGMIIDLPGYNPYPLHPFVSFTVSGFDSAVPGVRIGLSHKAWGGYLSANVSSGKKAFEYTCLGDGSIPAGGAIYTNGAKSLYHFGLTAGVLCLPIRFYGFDTGRAGLYAGIGYGERNLYWQDIENKWAKVADRSWTGLGAEGGLVLFWKWLCVSAGIHTTGFAHTDVEAGIGIRF